MTTQTAHSTSAHHQRYDTHVSGTVAGYAETDEGEVIFSGVAPDAQLMMMKVFPDQDGGAQQTVTINALEDALKLGADVINLSLGSDNGLLPTTTPCRTSCTPALRRPALCS